MNLSIKQKQNDRLREWTGGCHGGGEWDKDGLGYGDQQMQTGIFRMDKKQGPTVLHRELYPISCDKL